LAPCSVKPLLKMAQQRRQCKDSFIAGHLPRHLLAALGEAEHDGPVPKANRDGSLAPCLLGVPGHTCVYTHAPTCTYMRAKTKSGSLCRLSSAFVCSETTGTFTIGRQSLACAPLIPRCPSLLFVFQACPRVITS
jgi:hypothetical protein